MGTKLSLDEYEFDTLDMLAAREDEPLSFDVLYAKIWAEKNSSCNPDAARLKMEQLIKHVGEVGEGFMWIEHQPETGYIFRTRWGHNWHSRESK